MTKNEVIPFLELERDELLDKLRSLEMTILTLKQSASIPTNGFLQTKAGAIPVNIVAKSTNTKYSNYTALNIREKAVAILKGENRFLHMRQIVEIAQSLEPNVNKDLVKKQIARAFYNIKGLENSPIVSKVIDNVNLNTFWGSKNWLDENGNIKEEYKYDEDQIRDTKRVNMDI